MRFALFILGSRGDTQPYAALGRALQAQGQSVRICGPENFESFIRGLGLDFSPIPLDTRLAVNDVHVRDSLLKGDLLGFFLRLQRQVLQRRQGIQEAWIAAAQGADVLVGASTTDDALSLIGRALGKPVIFTELSPLIPSSSYAPIALSTRSLGPLNYPLHWLSRQMWWRLNRPLAQSLAQALATVAPQLAPSLSALKSGAKVLHGFSTALFTPPPSWTPNTHCVTGAWRLDRDDALSLPGDHHDAGVAAWLEDGPPPIYLSFGSMPAMGGGDLLELAGDLAAPLVWRVVLGTGWNSEVVATCDLPEGVALSAECDHAWLFERCCAVVHHGGAGTTQCVAAAGLPCLLYTSP